jgi:hypothetical protein
MEFLVVDLPPRRSVILALGAQAQPPIALAGGCALYFDPAVVLLAILSSTRTGTFRHELRLPDAPALLGETVVAQAIAWPGDAGVGAVFTDGVALTFGRR